MTPTQFELLVISVLLSSLMLVTGLYLLANFNRLFRRSIKNELLRKNVVVWLAAICCIMTTVPTTPLFYEAIAQNKLPVFYLYECCAATVEGLFVFNISLIMLKYIRRRTSFRTRMGIMLFTIIISIMLISIPMNYFGNAYLGKGPSFVNIEFSLLYSFYTGCLVGFVYVTMNYGYYKNYGYQELTIHRTFLNPDGSPDAMFDQVAFMPRHVDGHNFKVGMDYFASKKTTLGFVASGFIDNENQLNYNTSYLKNASNEVDSIVNSTSDGENKWTNGNLNLNFRHEFDSTGRELTADLDYSKYSSTNNQLFTNASFNPNGTKRGQSDLLGDLPVDINIYSAKMDYTHPLKKNAKIEAGVKSSYVNTDNQANYFNM